MIQPVDMDEQGSARFCRVHDMILDLIISLSTRENFVTILEGSCLVPPELKIRRSSLQGKVLGDQTEIKEEHMMILPATVNMSHARSLVVFGDAVQWMPPLSRFSVLRVLSLMGVPGSVNHHLEDLERLHNLRYLQLGGQLETGVLLGIGKLKLLKTLDVWATSIEQLPASIVELGQLERLLMYKGLKLPDGIGNLTSLQELSVLDADKSPHTLAELGKLTELRVLTIYGLGGNESSSREIILQSLSNLGNLRILQFEDEEGQYSLDLDGMSHQWRAPAHLQCFKGGYVVMSQLPQWFSSLSELSCLSIKVKVLRQADLRLLGALPMLRFLELLGFYGTASEELVVGADQPFRSLVEFKFAHYTRDWLVFTQGVMPKLQRLKLFCSARSRYAGGFDIGLENLACLKHVAVKVIYRGAQIWRTDIVEHMITVAIKLHPNNPTFELSRVHQYNNNVK
ncbi:disease resistance protein RGA5-like [Miscanthus floridulus]|uniref:disease resistance protein RGA5-like n=1 Tax=Miscanthus floridulus TaxID=154761 RepID=UPI003458E991